MTVEIRQLTAKDLGAAVMVSGVSIDTPSSMLLLARHLAALGADMDIAQMQGSLEDFQPYYQEVLKQAADEGYVDETDTGWTFTLAHPIQGQFANNSLIEEIHIRRPLVEELRDNPSIRDPYKQGVARLRKLSGLKPQDLDNIPLGDYNFDNFHYLWLCGNGAWPTQDVMFDVDIKFSVPSLVQSKSIQ